MAQPPPQFDPRLKELLVRQGATSEGDYLSAERGQREIAVLARLHYPDIDIPGLQPVARMGSILTGRIRLADITRIRRHPNVASLKATNLWGCDLDDFRSGAPAGALLRLPESMQRRRGIDGRGVIVGIVDWGLDVGHPAFQDDDGRTRVTALWDQRGRPNPRSPQPYGYGREFLREDIDAALATGNPYEAMAYDPAATDHSAIGSHGTHVASIAAGRRWRPGAPEGVASGADIMFVHLRGDDTHPEDSLGDSARVLEAVDYLLNRAGDTPIAINLSLGRTGDAKDGTSPVEQALDAAVSSAPNRVISMSTGNYFSARLHAAGQANPRGKVLRWLVPERRRDPAELEVWYAGDHRIGVTLYDPYGNRVLSVGPGESAVRHREGVRGGPLLATAHSRLHDPNNGDNQVNLFLHPAAPGGTWRIELTSLSPRSVPFHAWIERLSPRQQGRFHPADADPNNTVGTICCGHRTIATAAYDPASANQRITAFSSAGPTRDGRMVPVITAPGGDILGAKSTTFDVLGQRVPGASTRKSGTSMAAPHVTGTAACMLQAGAPLWASEVRAAIVQTARPAHPWMRYGAGILNTERAVQAVARSPHGSANGDDIMDMQNRYQPDAEEVSYDHFNTLAEEAVPEEEFGEYIPWPGEPETLTDAAPGLEVEDNLAESPREGSAELSFENLRTVNGSDGRPHIFAMTTGNPHGRRLIFRLKIRNPNTLYNFLDTKLMLRLSTQRAGGIWETVPLPSQAQGSDWLIEPSVEVRNGTSVIRSLEFSSDTLRRAYDNNHPLTRLQVEFHWREGASRMRYMKANSVTFHLFNPVELLESRATRHGQLAVNQDTPEHRRFWTPVWGRTFGPDENRPIPVQISMTTSLSSSNTDAIEFSSRTSETRETSTTVSASATDTRGGELSFGLTDIVSLGISSERSYSLGVSVTNTRSLTREFAQAMRSSRTFTRGLSTTVQVTDSVNPVPGGRGQLVLYPVFEKMKLDIVRFSDIDQYGMAGRREHFRQVPMLRFTNWESRNFTPRSPSQREDEGFPAWVEPRLSPELSPTQHLNEAAEQLAEAGANRQLIPDEVRYLVLEGGGGKGLVYLGAIKALERVRRGNGRPVLDVQNRRLSGIAGVAGSSAGAITALGLSMGMTSAELERISDPRYKDFDEFFDIPTNPRKRPAIGRPCINATSPSVLDRHVFGPLRGMIESGLRGLLPDAVERLVDPADIAARLTGSLNSRLFQYATGQLQPGQGLSDKLLSPALLYYAQNLWQDLGLFSGCGARAFLDSLIQQRGGSANMTFAAHQRTFGVKLIVTGSNLETGTTNMFSADHTPNMPVADAVRISMSLPGLFKPVRISSSAASRIVSGARIRPSSSTAYKGLYVDGGLWNNLPMPVFAVDEGNRPGTLGLASGTGALRRVAVNDLGEYLGALLKRFSGDDALANAYPSYRRQVITLNTGNIGTADFSPNPSELAALQREAEGTVARYFSTGPGP